MPEGHLLHRWAAEQHELLAGRVVRALSPQGRFAAGAADLDRATLERVEAWGKHLLYDFADAPPLHVHLGMAGLFLVTPRPPLPEPRPGVRLRLATDTAAVDLIAPSACELVDDARRTAIVAKLGPDPLRADADEEDAVRRLRACRASVGAALLDQTVWAGLGNAYRAELLYLARVNPTRPAATLTEDEARALWRSAVAQLTVGRSVGTIATVDGKTDAKWVYKQEHCRGCGAPVTSAPLGGRTSYHCPVEQPS